MFLAAKSTPGNLEDRFLIPQMPHIVSKESCGTMDNGCVTPLLLYFTRITEALASLRFRKELTIEPKPTLS